MCNSSMSCSKSCSCVIVKITNVLLVIGGLNWGLIGAGILSGSEADWNLVHMALGPWPMVEGLVYLLVGISALVFVFGCKCSVCTGSDTTTV